MIENIAAVVISIVAMTWYTYGVITVYRAISGLKDDEPQG